MGELAEDRTQRQSRPIGRRPAGSDGHKARRRIVHIRPAGVHDVRGTAFQQYATGRTLEPGGDDDVRLRLFDGPAQQWPRLGKAHGKADRADGKLHPVKAVNALLRKYPRHLVRRIDLDAVVMVETGNHHAELLHTLSLPALPCAQCATASRRMACIRARASSLVS